MGTLLLVKAQIYCHGENSSNISCAGEQLCSMWWNVGGFLHRVRRDGALRGWGAISSRAFLLLNSEFCRKKCKASACKKQRDP